MVSEKAKWLPQDGSLVAKRWPHRILCSWQKPSVPKGSGSRTRQKLKGRSNRLSGQAGRYCWKLSPHLLNLWHKNNPASDGGVSFHYDVWVCLEDGPFSSEKQEVYYFKYTGCVNKNQHNIPGQLVVARGVPEG